MLPSAEAEPERYRGRPLLVVLENYVLAAIGTLPPEKHAGVGKLVQHVFGGGNDWLHTIRQRLELNEDLDESLRAMWERNAEVARQNAVPLHPIQFAKMFVDQNWRHLVEPLQS